MDSQHEEPSRRFLAGWIAAVSRAAWAIVVVAILATVGAGYFTVTNLKVDASIDNMLSKELPFRKTETAISEAFPLDNSVLSVIVEAEDDETADRAASALAARLAATPARFHSVFYPEGLPFFQRNGLLYLSVSELEDLSDKLIEAQPLLATLSADPTLRGLADILALAIEQSDASAAAAIAPALNRIAATVRKLEEGRDARLSWQSIMSDAPAEGGATARKFILVQPVLDHGSLDPVTPAIDAVDAAARALNLDEAHGVAIRYIGNALMLQEELETVRDGMGLVGAISLGLVVVLLVAGLRSLRLVTATLITLVAGLLWTAAFAVAAFEALNIISVAFAVLFIGLSVDFGIHFALRYREAIGGAGQREALKEAGKGVGLALLLSAIAAAIGFLSFLPTDYRGVSELGVISGVGMFIALFLNLTLLPALLTIMPVREMIAPPPQGAKRSLYRRFVRRNALVIVIGAVLLAAVSALIAPYAWFDDDPLNLRDPKSPSVQTLLDLLEDTRVEPYAAELLAPNVAAAEELAERFRALPQVESATTIADLVPKEQADKRAIIDDMALVMSPLLNAPKDPPSLTDAERRAAFDKLRTVLTHGKGAIAESARNLSTLLDGMPRTPETLTALENALLGGFPDFRARLAALLSPEEVTLADLPEGLRARQVAADGKALVEIKPAQDLRDPIARQDFVDAVRTVAPETSGPPVRFTAVGETVVGAFRQAAITAGVLILLLLFVVLRRLRDVLLVLAPLALAILVTVALTVLFTTPFNLANIIVLPLVLGLGVAFGIQIVMRERSDSDGGFMETSTPRAVVFSALTTIGSFGALAMSNHPGTASMGLLLMLSISLTMICTLLVLP
ncbi:MAG: MMPL family transporter, partial [Gammaproteobacteria bacterium]